MNDGLVHVRHHGVSQHVYQIALCGTPATQPQQILMNERCRTYTQAICSKRTRMTYVANVWVVSTHIHAIDVLKTYANDVRANVWVVSTHKYAIDVLKTYANDIPFVHDQFVTTLSNN
jgi:hypothetical protein